MTSERIVPLLQRLPTGIKGLDVILRGGLFQGGSYIVIGPPGSGKTILGNQLCFNHVAAGGRAIYVTLLAETHARMLAHLSSFGFYDAQPIADSLFYFSGYQALTDEGPSGLLQFLRRVLREHRATLLVVDGLETVEDMAVADLPYRRFLHELHVFVEALGCTSVLLSQPSPSGRLTSEQAMADGLIELADQLVGQRAVRLLYVRKLRGSDYLRGQHVFDITSAGVVVYPRTEVWLGSPPAVATEQRVRLGFGVTQFDAMLAGGLLSSSMTMLLGAPGSGKTLLGLHFLAAGARAGEPTLYFGFYETPPRLIEKGDQIGLSISDLVAQGLIDILWVPPLEKHIDALAEQIFAAVERRRIRRLFIDGLEGFSEATAHPDRISRFFTALTNELRARDVTTIISAESGSLVDPAIQLPLPGAAEVVENIIFLRYVERGARLHRLISVLKTRESGYDPTIHEFDVSARGIDVAKESASAEAILTGLSDPRRTRPGISRQRSPRGRRSHG